MKDILEDISLYLYLLLPKPSLCLVRNPLKLCRMAVSCSSGIYDMDSPKLISDTTWEEEENSDSQITLVTLDRYNFLNRQFRKAICFYLFHLNFFYKQSHIHAKGSFRSAVKS